MTANGVAGASKGGERSRSPRPIRWRPFVLKILVCLALALAPWPGLGRTWSDTFCGIANALLVPIFSSDDERILYKPKEPESAPWLVKAYFGQRSTLQTAAYDVDARSPYLSFATYFALAAATLWQRRKVRKILVVGLPTFVAALFLNQALFVALALCELGWHPLPGAVRLLLQIPFTTANSLLGMTFAVPGFVWWLCLDRPLRKPTETSTEAATAAPQERPARSLGAEGDVWGG